MSHLASLCLYFLIHKNQLTVELLWDDHCFKKSVRMLNSVYIFSKLLK